MGQKKDQKTPVIVDHHRRIPVSEFAFSDPDDDGARLLTIDTPGPDSFIFYVPEYVVDATKEKLNGGVVLAKPGDISDITKKD